MWIRENHENSFGPIPAFENARFAKEQYKREFYAD